MGITRPRPDGGVIKKLASHAYLAHHVLSDIGAVMETSKLG